MSLEAFFEDEETPVWGSPIEKQRRLRIKLCIAAYAYEFESESIISDAEFDKMCLDVDLTVDTENEMMDNYFKQHFDPSTGQWIHQHPEINKIKDLYSKYYAGLAQR
jgi:predicted small secreted protein